MVVKCSLYFLSMEPYSVLVNEYHRVQKAFYEKIKPTIDDSVLALGYGNLVELIGRGGLDSEVLKSALTTAKHYLKIIAKLSMEDVRL